MQKNYGQLPRPRLGLAKSASVLASVLWVNASVLASVLRVNASVLVLASTKVSWSHHWKRHTEADKFSISYGWKAEQNMEVGWHLDEN